MKKFSLVSLCFIAAFIPSFLNMHYFEAMVAGGVSWFAFLVLLKFKYRTVAAYVFMLGLSFYLIDIQPSVEILDRIFLVFVFLYSGMAAGFALMGFIFNEPVFRFTVLQNEDIA